MDKETDSTDPPRKDASDIPLAVVRSVVGMVPVVGGAINQWISFAISEPVSKRRDEWLKTLAEGMQALRDRVDGLAPETLAEDPVFVTVALNATQMAMRTHQAEKIEALRNAVLNAALGRTPDDHLVSIFLTMVDRLTPMHLSLLAASRNPRGNPAVVKRFQNAMTSSIGEMLRIALPDLPEQEILDIAWRDLADGGLLNTKTIHGMMSANGALEKRTTSLGDRFLDFITTPAELTDGGKTQP